MKIFTRLEKSKNFWFLLITIFSFFLLRLPSLFEPSWYGDEGVYQAVGEGIKAGRLLYRDVFDNKPPLLYLLYTLFSSDQFLVRLASLSFGILSIVVFFFLVKAIFTSEKNRPKISFMTTFVFAVLFGVPLIEGNIANAENFMILPILLSALLIINASSKKQEANLSFVNFQFLGAGFLLGIAFLFKIVAIFDLAAFLLFWYLLKATPEGWMVKIKNFLGGFLLPVFLTTLFFLLKGAFFDFLKAVFSSNIGYVGYANFLGIPHGLLLVKALSLFLFVFFIFLKKKTMKSTEIFLLLWFGFSLFNAFFSGRPYTHYLLVLLPSFSLILGFLFLEERKKRMLYLLLIIITVLIINKNFSLFGYKKTGLYYHNFLSFIAGKRSSFSYQSFFDRRVPTDYAVAQFVKSRKGKSDQVFVWGNNAQLYKLIGTSPFSKYIVEYHIVGYKDGQQTTKKALEETKPKFIIIMPGQPIFPFNLSFYSHRINIDHVLIYERFL